MTVEDITKIVARKYEVALWEGMKAIATFREEQRLQIIQFIVDLLLKEVRALLDGEKDIADVPFAALVDEMYQENTPKGCYFCDTSIDGNAVPFDFPPPKMCLTCQIKVANLLQAFGISPRSVFPGMPDRKAQKVKYQKLEPRLPGEEVH